MPAYISSIFVESGIHLSGRILLISGKQGVGKTTLCRKVVLQAQAAGRTCGGVLTFAVEGTERRAVVNVQTGEARPLTVSQGGVRLGRFRFDPRTLEWGKEILARAIPCDLFVVDEIGPLEIERQEGWVRALDLLRDGSFRLALIVVRPELIHPLQLRLPASAPTVLTVTPENRDQLPDVLFDMLEREVKASANS
jgi:nucleoside-triphosphatase THEP1